jgi:hypothetical protein
VSDEARLSGAGREAEKRAMTRGELAERIEGGLRDGGFAVVPASDVWAALAGSGADASLTFIEALRSFVEYHGWEVEQDDPVLAGSFGFYLAGQRPPGFASKGT